MPYENRPFKRPRQKQNATKRTLARNAAKQALAGYVRTEGYYNRYEYGPNKTSELKLFDTFHGNQADIGGGIIAEPSFNLIPQGVDFDERVGRKITVKEVSVHARFEMGEQASMGDMRDYGRLIIYQDKQCNGAVPLVTDILGPSGTNDLSFNDLSNKNRFRTLMSITCDMNQNSAIWDTVGVVIRTAAKVKTIEQYKKVNFPIEFSGSTGALATIRSNNIGALFITYKQLVNCQYYVRIRYSDQ